MNEELARAIAEHLRGFKSLLVLLVILAGINIISFFAKWISEGRQAKINRKTNKTQIIDNKRVDVYEELYFKLNKLRNYLAPDPAMLTDITDIRNFVAKYHIYLQKNTLKTVHNYLDYFTAITANFNQRLIETEIKLLYEYAEQFNK